MTAVSCDFPAISDQRTGGDGKRAHTAPQASNLPSQSSSQAALITELSTQQWKASPLCAHLIISLMRTSQASIAQLVATVEAWRRRTAVSCWLAVINAARNHSGKWQVEFAEHPFEVNISSEA